MNNIEERTWDAIVIGTGMGGGVVGRVLAEAGLSVLFVEKGPAGYRSEQTRLNPNMEDPAARQLRGFWPGPVVANVQNIETKFFAPLGCGVGGSSVFYAAALERPEPHDLDDMNDKPHPTGGWPISYAEMEPWLSRAEIMFAVCGEPDPLSDADANSLRPPPPLNAGEAAMMERMRAGGLHPYRLHSALRNVRMCHACLGFKCHLPCKMDSRSAGVEPALATRRATILDNCEITRINGTAGSVTHLEARHKGCKLTLRARSYVLAGGALASPRLLLASSSETWPNGCANSSGQVGRNLMFHLNEIFAIWPKVKQYDSSGSTKAIALRDLYYAEGMRFGIIQAMGIAAREGEILHSLRMMLARSALRHVPTLRQLARLPAILAARILGEAQIFVGLLEDLPYEHNRVSWTQGDGDTIRLEYRFQPELLLRRRRFRRRIKFAFKGQRHIFLTHQPELNFGHPSGTLRMGTDPRTSVLNPDCRAHEIHNLWVTDGSFMPTSMGVNPSLTIAANALRVANKIIQST